MYKNNTFQVIYELKYKQLASGADTGGTAKGAVLFLKIGLYWTIFSKDKKY